MQDLETTVYVEEFCSLDSLAVKSSEIKFTLVSGDFHALMYVGAEQLKFWNPHI